MTFKAYAADAAVKFTLWILFSPGTTQFVVLITEGNYARTNALLLFVGYVMTFWRITLFYLYLLFYRK